MDLPDTCSLVICFKTSPVLTPTWWWERKWLLWVPWLCDYESNCLVLTDLHNGGELPEFCFGEVFPVSAVPHAVLVSWEGSQILKPCHPPSLEGAGPLITLYHVSLVTWTLKSRGSSCPRSVQAMGNVFRHQSKIWVPTQLYKTDENNLMEKHPSSLIVKECKVFFPSFYPVDKQYFFVFQI